MNDDDLRIYAVIAETVQVPIPTGPGTYDFKTVYQPNGRAMAQGEHVVSKMRMNRLLQYLESRAGKKNEMPLSMLGMITTINKSVRNSMELGHIRAMLALAKLPHEVVYDVNPDAYGFDATGRPNEVMTAVCTWPTTKEAILDLIGYLPLWKNGVSG